MTKKSIVTQDLVNTFPPNSRIRTEDQSNGFGLFNTLAIPMEKMDKSLENMRRNQYLSTANIDEVDVLWRIRLPTTYTFSVDTTDPLNPSNIVPTFSGLVINDQVSGYFTIDLVEGNNLEELWYKAKPTRFSLETTVSGTVTDRDWELLSQDSSGFPSSGLLVHHLIGGGSLYVETTGGTEYVKINDRKEVQRGRIILRGTTRKGSIESETLIFAWDQKQKTLKQWKKINDIEVYDIQSGVQVDIRSADYNTGPYMSFYNLRRAPDRNKIDEFYDLGASSVDSRTTLDRIAYVSNEWQNLMLGFSETETREQWELLDDSDNEVVGVDMSIRPFSDQAWIVTSGAQLYCYSLEETMVSGTSFLQERTDGPHAQLEIASDRIVLGEDISIIPWHTRPLQDILHYEMYYEDPNGTQSGLLAGEPVDIDSDLKVYGPIRNRMMGQEVILTSYHRGEYKFYLDTTFEDGTIHKDRKIVSVQYKKPETYLDLSTAVSGVVDGLDWDADQKLWIKAGTDHHQINLHADLMLIDFDQKVVYFREDYSDVGFED